jgi:hypothetical protein
MLYSSSNQEINSNVPQLYSILYDFGEKDKKLIYEKLKNTITYTRYLELKNFDLKYYEKIDYDSLIDFFKELNTIKTNKNFKILIPRNKNEVEKILNEYIKIFRKKSKKLRYKIEKIIDEVIDDL